MVWLHDMPKPVGTLNYHKAINQSGILNSEHMKIYHVGVSVKVSCGISNKNLTAWLVNLQFTFTTLF